MSPGTLEAVGVNELFVTVTVDVSFTTEQAGHIDEIHILSVVRSVQIVGYLSPSQICDSCSLLRVRNLDMEIAPDSFEDFLTKAARVSDPWCPSTSSLFAHLTEVIFLENLFVFSKNSRPIPVNRRCLLHPHFRAHV